MYNHYKILFDITQYHKLSMTDINEMIPYEREIYVDMIVEKMNSEKQEQLGGGAGVPIETML